MELTKNADGTVCHENASDDGPHSDCGVRGVLVNQEQIEAAEAKQAKLLARSQKIDRLLSILTPADPNRAKLKAEKVELLPRYRGAKTHAKNLRRVWNSLPNSLRQTEGAVERELDEVVEDVDREELLAKLYTALTSIASDARDARPVTVEIDELEVIEDFLNWWEHIHG